MSLIHIKSLDMSNMSFHVLDICIYYKNSENGIPYVYPKGHGDTI